MNGALQKLANMSQLYPLRSAPGPLNDTGSAAVTLGNDIHDAQLHEESKEEEEEEEAKEETHLCPSCHVPFRKKSQMIDHMAHTRSCSTLLTTVAPGARVRVPQSSQCSTCNKRFWKPADAIKHGPFANCMHPTLAFKCPIQECECGPYRTPGDLRKHLRAVTTNV